MYDSLQFCPFFDKERQECVIDGHKCLSPRYFLRCVFYVLNSNRILEEEG
jgi:hypothetical protein